MNDLEIVLWYNVYEQILDGPYASKEEADEHAKDDRKACVVQ